MPEVALSIVIPVFKKPAKVLEKCIKSILDQSLGDYEIIAVLDGPDADAKASLKRALKNAKNAKVYEIEHGGACRARNYGTEKAVGRYVVCLDADVYIEPGTAKTWVEQLDANPDVAFIYAGYRFANEQGALESQPFDPYLLRVSNYISACFPVRREFLVPWNETLESLQDWDFWLSVVEKGGKGKYMNGFAFVTEFPDKDSISGKGCTDEKWLERVDVVKKLHNIPIKETCIASVNDRLDGIALAKALDADYHDTPNWKPNHYKTIIQLGFSLKPGEFERCAEAWGQQHKKVLFWTADDVIAVHDNCSLRSLGEYSKRVNLVAKQYVEDIAAKEIMTRAGFNVEVLPLPTISKDDVAPLPEKPKFLVDVSPNYGHVFNAIIRSIPDISLEIARGTQNIEKYSGLVCFHQDRLLKPSVKRTLAAGRHVISNIQQAFAGYIDDRVTDAQFIIKFVNTIRSVAKKKQSKEAVKFYIDPKKVTRIMEAVR